MSKYLVYGKENPEESSKESNDLKSYYEENEFKPYIPQLDQGFTYRPDESFITPVSQEELQTPLMKEELQTPLMKEERGVRKPEESKILESSKSLSKRLSKSEFKKTFMKDAQRVASKLQIDPNVILALAYLESGGNPSKPMFGIKAQKGYKGKSRSYNTKEEVNGQMVGIKDSFRTYDSHSDAFDDYGNLISNNRYKHAIGLNPREYYQAIKNAGYATDSNYVNKLMSVYNDMFNA